MFNNTEKLIARILFIPISAFFAFHLFVQFGNSFNGVISNFTEDLYHLYLRFDTRETVIIWIFSFWLVTYFILELATFFSENFRLKRLLTNFRYAPIVVQFLFIFIVAIFDFSMIEHSKWKIRNYVFSDSQTIEKPDIRLHNNYRHWCGNGASSWENYLYFDSASEGINDENPYVRSRSLLMANDVQNWINGGDDRFDKYLEESCRDSNQIVRSTAESLLNGSEKSCEQLISSR